MPTPRVDGIDISHWNVIVSEAEIPPYPLMSCKATEGRSGVSKTFAKYWQMFGRFGVHYRGAYHWVRSDSTMQAQVDHLARRLDAQGGLQRGDFVQLDWETTPGIPNVTDEQIEEWVELAHIRWGDRVIVYGSDWVPDFLAWRKSNPTIPIWYANYNTSDKATGGWAECKKYDAAVWQWSSTYKVPGFLWNPDNVTDGIDVNHVFDWATLDRICDRQPMPPPDPPPIVIPPPTVQEEDDMRAVIYTVRSEVDSTTEYVWIKVNDDDSCREVVNGSEYQRLVRWGAEEAEAETTGHFREMLRTYTPGGELTAKAQAILGVDAVTFWYAQPAGGEQVVRVKVDVTGP